MQRLILGLVIILTSGCSMEASIISLDSISKIVNDLQKTTALVSSSSQTGTAAGGGGTSYIVQSTVGNYTSAVEQVTTDNTYKVYSSVQGAIISD